MQDRPAPLPQPLLSVDSLEVERGGRTVISGLSFALVAGEAILAEGRNGAGKSTLLRTLAGLLPARAGRIEYALSSDEVRGVESVHYLGYEDALKPTLTVEENLAFWASMLGCHPGVPKANPELTGMEAWQHHSSPPPDHLPRCTGEALPPRAALDAFGIARLATLPAAYLSAGQKRRVALARLLLAPRPIWLLDEPLIALDTGAQATLTMLMAAHLEAGGAILVASHQPLALPHRAIDLAARVEASE